MGRLGLVVSGLLFWGVAVAAPTPTPDQIEQFKRLSPEQQREIAAKLGVDPKVLSSATGGANSVTPLAQPDVVTPRAVGDASALPSATGAAMTQAATPAVPESAPVKGGLKRFGYDLFAGSPSTFAPVTEVPIPAEYVLGPGDVLRIQLFGARTDDLQLQVGRDGRINFPGLGPISVAGMSFESASEALLKRISQQLIGVQASITVGELRSMRIFVLGDAFRPGSYTVSALSTMTNALFVSGGVQEIGSLRNIQLKRNGRLVGTLDLYDLLLRGDTSKDLRLQPGDVIFIPSVGATASISGKVRRPAIYELKPGETVDALVRMAGGLEADAYSNISVLERITADKVRTVRDLNLADRQALGIALRDGDSLDVRALGPRLDQSVEFVGALERPGKYEWRRGVRVADVIRNPRADLAEDADLSYALVVRERNLRGEIEVLQFDLGRAVSEPRSTANLELKPRDRVLVFQRANDEQVDVSLTDSLLKKPDTTSKPAQKDAGLAMAGNSAGAAAEAANERAELLKGVMRQLQQQSRLGEPVSVVTVEGEVHFPGQYPLPVNASVEEMLRAAGGLKDSAYAFTAEVTRTNTEGGTEARVEHLGLNLKDPQELAAFRLQSRDRLTIRQIPEWSEALRIELRGEVRHPGVYTFRRGETLSQVLRRAGGLTSFAYARGAVYTRQELRQQEQEQLQQFEAKLNAELASQALTAEGAQSKSEQDPAKLAQLTQMLDQVRSTRAVGRVVIDLPKVIKYPDQLDVVLEDGDSLIIPRQKQSVTVIGEVQHPTSHFFDSSLSMKDYLSKSGGYTSRADDDRVYVIQANGAVKLPGHFLWFHGDVSQMEPGDTVVAPLDTTYLSPLTMWTQITQIIYHSAVAVAAIASL